MRFILRLMEPNCRGKMYAIKSSAAKLKESKYSVVSLGIKLVPSVMISLKISGLIWHLLF